MCDNVSTYEVFSAVFESPDGQYLGVTMPMEDKCYSDVANTVSALAPALMGGGTAGMASSYDKTAGGADVYRCGDSMGSGRGR